MDKFRTEVFELCNDICQKEQATYVLFVCTGLESIFQEQVKFFVDLWQRPIKAYWQLYEYVYPQAQHLVNKAH